MNVPARLATFAVMLVGLFGIGAALGAAIDPAPAGGRDRGASHAGHGANGSARTGAVPVRGLAVAEHGLRLELAAPELAAGTTGSLTYEIVDDTGAVVRDFDVEHERRMHLIVVRRDLTGFQHLHPEQGADGTWTTELRIDDPGSYRVLADFVVDGEPTTLATDLRVDGDADLRDLPEPASTAASDAGTDVALGIEGDRAGRESLLRFTITRDGSPVATEQYLGAGGHLVALREGDLAFLHVHPTGHGAAGHDADHGGTPVEFATTFPTAGRYRLFLQFQVDGRVETVAFTTEVR